MDRAALDAALDAGVACGGWCPAGRRAEDGRIPERYPLRETPSPEYAERTRRNVRDSDGTLILGRRPLRGGTALTAAHAEALGRPLLVVDPTAPEASEAALAWCRQHAIRTLNVAGPRESEAPGVYESARAWLDAVFGALAASGGGSSA